MAESRTAASTASSERPTPVEHSPDGGRSIWREFFAEPISALLRWTYVLLLFLYLFALVTALFQAHGFQQRVAQLIATEDGIGVTADDNRRQVVLDAVRQAEAQARRAGPIQTLLDGVAGRVDSMRVATDELIELNAEFGLVPDAGAESPEARFKRLRTRIDDEQQRLAAAATTAWISLAEPGAEAGTGDGASAMGGSGSAAASLRATLRSQTMEALMHLRRDLSMLLPTLVPRDAVQAEQVVAAKAEVERALSRLFASASASADAGARPPMAEASVTELSVAVARLEDALPDDATAIKDARRQALDRVIMAAVRDAAERQAPSAVSDVRPHAQTTTDPSGATTSGRAAETEGEPDAELDAEPDAEPGSDPAPVTDSDATSEPPPRNGAKEDLIEALLAMRRALPTGQLGQEGAAAREEAVEHIDALVERTMAADDVAASASPTFAAQDAAQQALRAAFEQLMQLTEPRAMEGPACLDIDLKALGQPWEAERVLEMARPLQSDQRVPDIRAILIAAGDAELAAAAATPAALADERFDEPLGSAIIRFRRSPWASERGSDPQPNSLSIADETLRALLVDWVEEARQEGRVVIAAADACRVAQPSPGADIKRRIDALGSVALDPRRQLIQQVFEPIAGIRSAIDMLQGLRLEDPTAQSENDATQAQRAVEDRLNELRTALAELSDTLDQQGSAEQTVARAMGPNVPDASRQAKAVLNAYRGLGSTQGILTPFAWLCGDRPDCGWAGVGFNAKDMATSGNQIIDLLVVFVMGATGSLLYITQYLLRDVIQGRSLAFGAGRSFAWLIFRPIFGVVIAFALYLIYKAGQIALGAGTATSLSSEVNLPILSTVALFAGLMSWHVLELVEERGRRMFANARRAPMYAVGLESMLRAQSISRAELAGHLGVTAKQVQRWIDAIDQVTPEMQDRIAAWLEVEPITLFSARKPSEQLLHRKANCLRAAMAAQDVAEGELARGLGVSVEDLKAWIECRAPVPPKHQFQLVRLLREDYDSVFCAGAESAPEPTPQTEPTDDQAGAAEPSASTSAPEPIWTPADMPEAESESADPEHPALWAVGLRRAIRESRDPSSANLASVLELSQVDIRAWMELDRPAPFASQALLAEQLGNETTLFAAAKPQPLLQVADPDRFREALMDYPAFDDEPVSERLKRFAAIIDVDLERLQSWLDPEHPGAIAPETAGRLLFELGEFVDGDLLLEQ